MALPIFIICGRSCFEIVRFDMVDLFQTVLKLMRDMVDLFQTVLNAFALDINNPAVA